MHDFSSVKVSLVLGSGGARGLAHIGVIKVLEEKGAIIDEVVGCSMGSLVGGLYACGKLDIFKDWVTKLTRKDVFRYLDFTIGTSGALKGIRIIEKLKEMVPDVDIETLPISYSAAVTELMYEEDMIINSGSLYEAIRASIGIPGIFTVINRKNMTLVDGGVLNPLPLNHVTKRPGNIVVAVNLDAVAPVNGTAQKQNAVSLLQRSYYASRRQLSKMSIEFYKPDYVIHVPDSIAGIWEYEKAKFLIEKGGELALEIL